MKNIYFIMLSMTGGGAEKVITHLLNNLSREKFELNLILFKKEGPNLKLLKDDINIIDLQASNTLFGVLKLFKVLISERVDVLFTSLGPLNAIISPFLFLLKDTKKIARETNIPSYIHDMKIKQGNKQFYIIKLLYKTAYKNYDLIVAQSDDMKEDMIENYGFKESQIVKTNNPIDFEFLDDKVGVNRKNPLDNGKINLVSAGRLTYQKGLDMLIDQMATIKNLDVKLSILGTGELEEELKTRVKELGLEDRVDFLGYKDNPYLYFKNSDVFVLPSRIEGFSNVALENLGLGIPVLANDFKGGINEMIVDGLNGKIINFENQNTFKDHLFEVYQYRENNKKIIKNVKEKYDKKIILNAYENIFLT